MMRALRPFLLVAFWMAIGAAWVETQNVTGQDNVILITLDGARIEEIFSGLDLEILRSTLRPEQKVEDSPAYRRFWADTPKARREKLLPFFWTTLMAQDGSIAGNPALGSSVKLANRHRFSYPGYSEILLGEPKDDVIKSNDPVQNPFSTVLEVLRERLNVPPEKVATVASWANFNAIVEHTPGATFGMRGRRSSPGAHDLRTPFRPTRRYPGPTCGTTRSPFESRWLIWGQAVPACCIWRSVKQMTGRMTAATIASSTRTCAPTDIRRAVELAAESTRLQGPHASVDHDRPRPRPDKRRLAQSRGKDRGRARRLDGLRVTVHVPTR